MGYICDVDINKCDMYIETRSVLRRANDNKNTYSALFNFIFIPKVSNKQDKVNSADSAFILLIMSKSMVRLVRAEKMVLSALVFARKIARMILIQNI